MFSKKIFLSFLLFSVLNIFCIIPTDGNYNNSVLNLNSDAFSTMQLYGAINQPSSSCNGNITTSVHTNKPRLKKYWQSGILPIFVAAKTIQAQYFPESQLITNEYKKKDVNCDYLQKQMESLACKYKVLMLQDPNVIENFSNLSTKDLNSKIDSLEQEKKTLTNYIKNCRQYISENQEIYYNMSRAHILKRPAKLKELEICSNNCADAMANLSITKEKIIFAADILKEKLASDVLKEKNVSSLQKAEELYNKTIKENSKKETLSPSPSTNDTSYQAMALERVTIARKICEQKRSDQCRDRTFDLTGISPEFLTTNGYNQAEISKLSGANDLQDFLQKDFINHIKENQGFKQEYGDKKLLSSLTDLHDKCIKKGLACNKAGDTKKAMSFSDLCWHNAECIKNFAKALENFGDTALEAIHALDKISCEAVKTFIDVADKLIHDYFKRPDQHITKLAEGALDGTADLAKMAGNGLDAVVCRPIQTIKKGLIVAQTLSGKAAEINTKCMNFCVESVENPNAAKEKILTLRDDVCQFIDNADDSLSRANKLEITHAIGEFAASGYLIGEAPKFADKFVKIVSSEVPEIFKKAILEIMDVGSASPVVATSEGLVMSMEGLKETAQNSAKVMGIIDETLNSANAVASDELIDQIIKNVEKNIQNNFQLIGQGTTLRNVDYMHGIKHGINKHFFDKLGKYPDYALKVLDPKGNPEKWIHHIINLAQTGEGITQTIKTGEIIEIMGQMPKTDGGFLNIGVRMFKPVGSDIWTLTTILT